MSFIGKVASDVYHGVKKDVEDVVGGAKKVAGGVGKIAGGVLSGNGHEAVTGFKMVGKGTVDMAKGGADLAGDATPEGAAMTVMLAGAQEGIKSLTGKSQTPASAQA